MASLFPNDAAYCRLRAYSAVITSMMAMFSHSMPVAIFSVVCVAAFFVEQHNSALYTIEALKMEEAEKVKMQLKD